MSMNVCCEKRLRPCISCTIVRRNGHLLRGNQRKPYSQAEKNFRHPKPPRKKQLMSPPVVTPLHGIAGCRDRRQLICTLTRYRSDGMQRSSALRCSRCTLSLWTSFLGLVLAASSLLGISWTSRWLGSTVLREARLPCTKCWPSRSARGASIAPVLEGVAEISWTRSCIAF